MMLVCSDDAFTDNQKNLDDLQTYSLKQRSLLKMSGHQFF